MPKPVKPTVGIPAENVRFEIAWTIPRQKFLKPGAPDGTDVPWWDDEKFRTEAAALPRYQELEALVKQYSGEVALYSVSYTEGDEFSKERLVRYAGNKKGVLRKEVMIAKPEVKAALAELLDVNRRGKTAATKDDRDADALLNRRASKGKGGGSWLWEVIFPVSATTALVGLAMVYEAMPTQRVPATASASGPNSYYRSESILPSQSDPRICEIFIFDNRTGRTTFGGKRSCPG
jgi:hypothetical protein